MMWASMAVLKSGWRSPFRFVNALLYLVPQGSLIAVCFQAVPNNDVDPFFGIKHTLGSRCTAGSAVHISQTTPARPEIIYNILVNGVATTRLICGPDATLQDHLEHLIPRCTRGNELGPDRLHQTTRTPCMHPKCKLMSDVEEIQTIWPNILHVFPETVGSSKTLFGNQTALPLPRCLNLFESTITHELVGRMHHHRNSKHYTCDRIFNDRLYESDDMRLNGNFIDIGSADENLATLDWISRYLCSFTIAHRNVTHQSALSRRFKPTGSYSKGLKWI